MMVRSRRIIPKHTFLLKCVGATAAIFIAASDCGAQGVQQIQVQGKDSAWKLVGTVDSLTPFQIHAKGNVKFGGAGQDDNSNAGVSSSAFAKWGRTIFSSGLDLLFQWLQSAAVSSTSGSDTSTAGSSDGSGFNDAGTSDGAGVSTESVRARRLNRKPAPNPPAIMHWNWVDYINSNGSTVNYDEGAFFVLLTTTGRAPSQGSGGQVAPPALYYWYKKIFDNGGNIAFDQKIWVWVKVHDGGRDPFSKSSFGDNKGSYTVWLDPDQQINDSQLRARISPPQFASTASAQKLKASAAAAMAGKSYHTSLVLQRKAPARGPS